MTEPLSRSATFGTILGRLATAQKSNRNAPAYSRWVNRPTGRVFAVLAFKLGLQPNHVTMVSAVFTFSGIAMLCVARPSWPMGIAVALLLMIGYSLDSADGQLARLRGGGSTAGEWLDHVVDCVKLATLHIAVLVAWFRFGDLPDWALIFPLLFSAQSAVWFFTITLTDQLTRSRVRGPATRPATSPKLQSLLAIPADYGLLCLLMVLLGAPWIYAVAYAALAVANVLLLAVQLPRWFRRVSALTSSDQFRA